MRKQVTKISQIPLSEREFQAQIIQVAEWNGWLIEGIWI